jgi:hypothetical protein
VTPRGRGAHGISVLAAFLVLASVLSASPALAGANLQLADPAAQPGYIPPGANLATTPPPPRKPVTEKWWFWAAVGGVVAATVVVVLVAGRDPSPPGSTLGNMDAWKGK